MLLGCGSSGGGASFVGPLDAYTADLLHLPCMSLRLLTSYTGPAFRMRVDTGGSPEYDIGFLSDGTIDADSVTNNAGGNNWFVRTVYDQSGNGRHLQQSTAASQPRGSIDGNGLAYCYAPSAGFNTSRLVHTVGAGIAVTDTTIWSVSSSAAYVTDIGVLRNNTGTLERRTLNFSSSLLADVTGAGTTAQIGSTNAGIYTVTCRTNSGGVYLSNRLSSATGTQTSAAFTIGLFGFGYGGGGASWAQNSAFYGWGAWSSDLGSSAVNAINALAQTLFSTQ